ncbi:MAG: hypothetical protein QOI35_1110 [Cryptosporangiaceae bacterium]|jgi:hypothetical protein|nr:hypothetical protein [Cryptosporangiaceae bacterium]
MTSDSGSAVPPYEGRRTAADVGSEDEAHRDGAKVGGASHPVEDSEFSAPDPEDTPGGATGLPADEQPASELPETDLGDDRTGPAHEPGTPRAEDQA